MSALRPLRQIGRRLYARLTHRHSATRTPIQAAALPWRRSRAGEIEILLVTSRSSGRWIIPKGRPKPGKTLAETAAEEAFEEAGVEGVIDERLLGSFEHLKRHCLIGHARVLVLVHPLAVERELPSWPEQHQRRRRWLAPAEAAELVGSEQLASLLRRLPAL